jgi:hypothetical protein
VPAQGVSHFFLNFGKSRLAMPQPMPQPMPVVDGDYEYRVTMTDATGAGWKVVAPFKVGAGGGPASTGIVLKPDADGRFDGSNAAGVNGRWWATGDDFGLDGTAGGGSCPMAGFAASDCSVLTTPTAGMAFHPDPNGKGMCTSGVSAKVVPGSDGMLAWSAIWGNIIGFHLAESGSDPYPANVRPYDAGAHGITGFAFDIDAVPPGGHIRVGFQTSGTENNPAYWGGAGSDVSPVFQPGHFEMRWRDVGGPMYLGANAPPFNPAQLVAIQFHVVSSNIAPVPFTFCVNNIMLLTN